MDEDLAQDALLRALIAFRRTNEVRNPIAFFAKIVRDTLYDYWRQRPTLYGLDGCYHLELIDSSSPEDDIDRRRHMRQLTEALNHLTVEEHRLITFFYFQELRIGEISALVGRSQSGIKMALLRGRKKIREFMTRQFLPVD